MQIDQVAYLANVIMFDQEGGTHLVPDKEDATKYYLVSSCGTPG